MSRGASDEEAGAYAQALSQLDAAAEVTIIPASTGLLPIDVGTIIVGAAAATAIAQRVLDVVCRARKVGMILDARVVPVQITESDQLPGGTVVTIDKRGVQGTHDACQRGFDLSKLASVLAR